MVDRNTSGKESIGADFFTAEVIDARPIFCRVHAKKRESCRTTAEETIGSEGNGGGFHVGSFFGGRGIRTEVTGTEHGLGFPNVIRREKSAAPRERQLFDSITGEIGSFWRPRPPPSPAPGVDIETGLK